MVESTRATTYAPLDAAVFDLDGVVTRTARVHFAAWKDVFDPLLRRRRPDERPFDHGDYLAYVDGRPRRDGVRVFLASRGIALPEDGPGDAEDADTVHALAARKDALFLRQLERLGVDVDAGAVALIRALRAAGVRVGVATSSRNAVAVLRRAGLEDLFEARVDGVVASELSLRGKPDPDAFVECARRLGAEPARALVMEDAAAGVAAGKAGGFALVVGVDRGGNRARLREAGADCIVESPGELSVERIARLLERRLGRDVPGTP